MNKYTIIFSLVLISSLATPLMAEERVESNYTTFQKISAVTATFAGISLGIGIISCCNPVPKILPQDASLPVCILTAGVFLATAAGTGGLVGYTLANKLIEKQKENKRKESPEKP